MATRFSAGRTVRRLRLRLPSGSKRFEAKSLDKEQRIVRRLNKAALDNVVHVPLGFWLSHQAWRKNVSGIVKGPLPFFLGGEQNRMI